MHMFIVLQQAHIHVVFQIRCAGIMGGNRAGWDVYAFALLVSSHYCCAEHGTGGLFGRIGRMAWVGSCSDCAQ